MLTIINAITSTLYILELRSPSSQADVDKITNLPDLLKNLFPNWSSAHHLIIIYIIYWLVAFIGAITLYIFSLYNNFPGTIPFLKRSFPNINNDALFIRIDFFLLNFLGSIIGLIFFNPQNLLEAFFAGVGWIGALNTAINRGSSTNVKRDNTQKLN